jgi:hypothetical protein
MTDVASSKSVVGQGYNTLLNITVTNQDSSTVVSNVTVYCNEEIVGTFSNVVFPASSPTTVEFDWNTTGFAYGNYTMSAVTDTNYNCTGGRVMVSIVGDVTGPNGWPDWKVNMRDIGCAARRFMCKPGDPLWDPNADINNDSIINMWDIGLVARNFGKTYP